ncbi:MAG TPA: S8 family serine peptidase [Symbiobacteriaceae bacterium]|nr:S8 family serine peptidase [Symbiobacteriaceae bacterium]
MKQWWRPFLVVVLVLAVFLGAGWLLRSLGVGTAESASPTGQTPPAQQAPSPEEEEAPPPMITTGKVTPQDLLAQRKWPVQYQGKDLTGLDLTGVTRTDLFALSFDTRTKWPTVLPAGFDPVKVLETGKDPGLGVRQLHQQGITGKGVAVAVIDFPMNPQHQEFDKSIQYKAFGPTYTHFHGAATASILAGKTVGVAPGAQLYFYGAGANSDQEFFDNIAKAIYDVLEVNKKLPAARRIRVISISTGLPNPVFMEAITKAEAAGVAVVHCGDWFPSEFDATGAAPDLDRSLPESYGRWLMWQRQAPQARYTSPLAAPADYRTTASVDGTDVYVYWGEGGRSWSAPYIAGVIALGMQVNPGLTSAEAYKALNETATRNAQGIPVINPQAFIARVRK